MALPGCRHCPNPARYRVTGTNYPTPVDVCETHLGQVQRGAGASRSTVGNVDDGVEALFEMPPVVKRAGLR